MNTFNLMAIDGPPGSGTTELAKALGDHMSARVILDQVHENPFLTSFYSDMRRYALHAQTCSLLWRYKQQGELAQPELFHQMTVTDYSPIKDSIFAGLTLNEDEHRLYEHLQSVLMDSFLNPDVILLLQANPDKLMSNLLARPDYPENRLDRAYLTDIAEAYDQQFIHFEGSPLLIIDVNERKIEDLDLENLIAQAGAVDGGRAEFEQ